MRARFHWSIYLPVVAVAAALVLVLVAPAADPLKKPAGLDLLPTEGMALMTINVAGIHDATVTKPIRDALLNSEAGMLKRIEVETGFTPEQIERVSFLLPTVAFPPTEAMIFTVTTRKPYEKAKVLKALKAYTELDAKMDVAVPNGNVVPAQRATPDVPKPATPAEAPKPLDLNAPFFYMRPAGVIIPIDDRTLVFATNPGLSMSPALFASLLRKRADGPLAEASTLANQHHVVLVMDGKQVRGAIEAQRQTRRNEQTMQDVAEQGGQPPKPQAEKVEDELTPFEPLAQFKRGVITVDIGEQTVAKLVAEYPTVEAAKLAETAAKDGLQALVKLLKDERKSSGEDADSKAFLPVYDFLLAGLEKANYTVADKTLTVTATKEVTAALTAALAVLPRKIQEVADRIRTANNLSQIATALQSYHDSNNSYPQDITDGDGKVLLSWRVHLLPFLNTGDVATATLLSRIDQTRAWDDPINKKLWEEMPDVFKLPGRETPEKGQTYFQAYRAVNWLGQNDCWLVDSRKVTVADVTDGLSNSLGLIETETAVNWMKPGNILFDTKKLPNIGNPKTGKANAVMLDGVHYLLDIKKYEGAKLIPLITVNGGEDVEVGR
jgi:type II secretory pathway pseudopilin PulG